MFRETSKKTVNLTRRLACQFAEMTAWKRDRSLKPSRLQYLGQQRASGLLRSVDWATAKLNGTIYRVNGQHTSHLFAYSEVFPAGHKVTIGEFECDTEQDVATLWGTFDNPEQVRNLGELVSAYAAVYSELDGVPATGIQRAIQGVHFYDNGAVSRNIDRKTRVDVINDEKVREFILFSAPFVKRRRLKRLSVVAAMYATWLNAPVKALEFWSQVHDEDHPDRNNGSRVLARFLRSNDVFFGRGASSTNTMWSARAFYVKSIHAWNAWNSGSSTSLRYIESASLPRVS